MIGILVFTFIFLIIGLVFLVKNIRKYHFVKNTKNKYLSWLITILPFIIIRLLFNGVNTIIIILHLIIFLIIAEAIIYIIKRICKKEFKCNITGIISIVCTIIYLSIGAYLDYHIFETKYVVETNKEIGTERFRILQISDSHIGATFTGKGFKKILDKIDVDPDIAVLTGDFVDDDTTKQDMIDGAKALGSIKTKYGIYYINGNHDEGYYNNREYSYEELINELEKNNIIILEDSYELINDEIYIVGRKDKRYNERMSIDELTKDLDKSKYIVDLNHQPNDYENEKNKVDLVLSGHSHGGQLFPLGYVGVWIGANDEFYGMHQRGNTKFIVNSGISNWAMDFKTGTKSEYTVIDIIKK